jgi:hypothetical protein
LSSFMHLCRMKEASSTTMIVGNYRPPLCLEDYRLLFSDLLSRFSRGYRELAAPQG